jgi:nitrite reductase/ring-hydroxylating ferredoxin subunit
MWENFLRHLASCYQVCKSYTPLIQRITAMPYQEIAKLHQLQDGYRRVIRFAGREWLFIHENGRSYLLKNTCPHKGAPLAWATLENGCLRCPQHGIAFDLTSGNATTANCTQRLEFLPLAYEGNSVGIYIDG